MKLTKLGISNYQQFKDITFDFTYPKGHELEGKPLKKVCFIGQSGTGKTTLLNLLNSKVKELLDNQILNSELPVKGINTGYIEFSYENHKFFFNELSNQYNVVDNLSIPISSEKQLLYLTTTIDSTEKGLFTKPTEEAQNKQIIVKRFPGKPKQKIDLFEEFKRRNALTINANSDTLIWKFILTDIDAYDKLLKRKIAEILQDTSKIRAELAIAVFTTVARRKSQSAYCAC